MPRHGCATSNRSSAQRPAFLPVRDTDGSEDAPEPPRRVLGTSGQFKALVHTAQNKWELDNKGMSGSICKVPAYDFCFSSLTSILTSILRSTQGIFFQGIKLPLLPYTIFIILAILQKEAACFYVEAIVKGQPSCY